MTNKTEKKNVFKNDPLEKIMKILVFLVAVSAYTAFCGYLLYTLVVWLVLLSLSYIKAPARSFPTAEAVCEGIDLNGKVVMITGPTSGIGTETARVMALRGAHVIMAARNSNKLEQTKQELEESLASRGVRGKFTCIELDLNDLDSVKRGAQEFLSMSLPLHFLINNAGIMALRERRSTKQGLEAQVGVCHIGHFLLTHLLLPTLQASKPARVVCLSSAAHRLCDWGFLNQPTLETSSYHEWVAYGNAKVSNIMMAKEINDRYADKGVIAFSLHPGGIHTGLQGEVDWYTMLKWRVVTPFFFKSIQQGAATTITCALTASSADGGKYFDNCKPTDTWALLEEKAPANSTTKLWNVSEAIVKEYL